MYFECLVTEKFSYSKVTKKIIRWFSDPEHTFAWLELEGYKVHYINQIVT